MTNYSISSSLGIISGLIGLLIILIIIRNIILKQINKKDVEIAQKTVIGYKEIQEDEIGIADTEGGILGVLATGIGKSEAGKVSSVYAVRTIKDMFVKEGSNDMYTYFFNKAYNKANHEIITRVEKDKGGACVLTVIINDGFLHYALVGDIILSIYRKGELFRISKGHSIDEVAKKQYIDGKMQKREAVSVYKEKKLIYYLGQELHKEIEMNDTPIKLQKDDIVILMSNGIFKEIKWIKLEEILGKKKTLEEISNEIISNVKNNCNGSILLMKYKVNK